jgi:hypothetical protein
MKKQSVNKRILWITYESVEMLRMKSSNQRGIKEAEAEMEEAGMEIGIDML